MDTRYAIMFRLAAALVAVPIGSTLAEGGE